MPHDPGPPKSTPKLHQLEKRHRPSHRVRRCARHARGRVAWPLARGISSKIHACTNGSSRILRFADSPGHHAGLRYARALVADNPATDAALDHSYISAKLRTDLAAHGCTVHIPPKQGMRNPPPWDKAIHVRRHHVGNLFSRLKDQARIALRRGAVGWASSTSPLP